MKKQDLKKLRLRKECLRALTVDRLDEIAGGIQTTSRGATCESACIVSCPSVVGC